MKYFHKHHVYSSQSTSESRNYILCVFLTLLRCYTYSPEHIGDLQLYTSSRIRDVQSEWISTSAFVLKTTKLVCKYIMNFDITVRKFYRFEQVKA